MSQLYMRMFRNMLHVIFPCVSALAKKCLWTVQNIRKTKLNLSNSKFTVIEFKITENILNINFAFISFRLLFFFLLCWSTHFACVNSNIEKNGTFHRQTASKYWFKYWKINRCKLCRAELEMNGCMWKIFLLHVQLSFSFLVVFIAGKQSQRN